MENSSHGIRALPNVGMRKNETGIQRQNDNLGVRQSTTETLICNNCDDFIQTNEEKATRIMLAVGKIDNQSTKSIISHGTRECNMFNFGEVFGSIAEYTPSSTSLANSGASHHIGHDRKQFTELHPFKGKFTIMQMDRELEVTHYGTVVLEVDGKYGKQKFSLGNVLLFECVDFNVFSLQKARHNHFYYGFDEIPGKIYLLRQVEDGPLHQIARMSEVRGRWILDARIMLPLSPLAISPLQVEARACSLSMDLLHRRLAQSGEGALKRLLRENVVDGVGKVSGEVSPCDACTLGKLTRSPHPAVAFDHATTRPLQLVVMDLA